MKQANRLWSPLCTMACLHPMAHRLKRLGICSPGALCWHLRLRLNCPLAVSDISSKKDSSMKPIADCMNTVMASPKRLLMEIGLMIGYADCCLPKNLPARLSPVIGGSPAYYGC